MTDFPRPGAAKRAVSAALRLASRVPWRRRRIVVFHAHPDFERKAAALADLLCAKGLPVVTKSGRGRRVRVDALMSHDLWIGFWNDFPAHCMPRDYVFFNGEPLRVPDWGENPDWMARIRGARAVFDYNELNRPVIDRIGALFHYVPFGYAPYYEAEFARNTKGGDPTGDLDVLFVGGMSPRRAAALAAIRDRGLRVHAVTRENPAYGADLDRLYRRASIVLGIHFHEAPIAQVADLARIDHLLSNRIFVLHERPAVSNPEFEEHVATAPYEGLADACARYRDDPVERQRSAESAHAWFKSAYSMDAFLPYDAVRHWLED